MISVGGEVLATATGFLSTAERPPDIPSPHGITVEPGQRLQCAMLVTNRHVLTGRNNDTGQPLDGRTGGTPELVEIWHQGRPIGRQSLYCEQGRAMWVEHPDLGPRVDVVGLAMNQPAIHIRPYDPPDMVPESARHESLQMRVVVGDDLFVVGFPFGAQDKKGSPIWTRASAATEPEEHYDDLPRFLVDARTRTGQSGSPVVAVRRSDRAWIDPDGQAMAGPGVRFLGVYSGRINDEADLGYVWTKQCVGEVTARGVRGSIDRHGHTVAD